MIDIAEMELAYLAAEQIRQQRQVNHEEQAKLRLVKLMESIQQRKLHEEFSQTGPYIVLQSQFIKQREQQVDARLLESKTAEVEKLQAELEQLTWFERKLREDCGCDNSNETCMRCSKFLDQIRINENLSFNEQLATVSAKFLKAADQLGKLSAA